MKLYTITARDLPDAWFQAVDLIINHGRSWIIDHGSYHGEKRLDLDYVTIHITDPGARPLIPELPPYLSIPPPTTMQYVEDEYLPYIMTNSPPRQNESYTYGTRVTEQMEEIIRRYSQNGFGSNQECIAVAYPEDIKLDDPPCLRQIDTKITNNSIHNDVMELEFFVYFRSNDLWGGFPANMAAIRLMQEYMAECIGVQAGEIVYSSKSLHLYNFIEEIAKISTHNQ